jgi:hypothetical protein
MATLTVRGRAVVPAEPDEATVVLALCSLQQAADLAYRDVAERNAALRAVCDELGALERVAEPDDALDGPSAVRSFASIDQATIDVEAGERLVRAAVDVSFVLEQG